MSELLIVMVIIGLVAGAGAFAWSQTRGRTHSTSAARTLKAFVHRARMQAVYRNLNHFVVLDENTRRLSIFADNGSTPGQRDASDELVVSASLSSGVGLALPGFPSLPDPLDGGNVTTAWPFPAPSGGSWSTGQRGVMVNPRGVFQTAEPVPQSIASGTIVFSTPGDDTTAVTIRGTLGAIRAFEYRGDSWSEM